MGIFAGGWRLSFQVEVDAGGGFSVFPAVPPAVGMLRIGEKHLVHGIGRGGNVLEIIGSIVPAAGNVERDAIAFSVGITYRNHPMRVA